MEGLFKEEDFELIRRYEGQKGSKETEAYTVLRKIYDKLGKVLDGLRALGYKADIIRKPTNQGGIYEEYHWGRVYPKDKQQYEACKDKVFFAVATTKEGINIHIDSYSIKGYLSDSGRPNAIKSKTWLDIPKEEAAQYSCDDLVTIVDEYITKHWYDFNMFAQGFGITQSIKILKERNMEEIKKLLLSNHNIVLTGAPGTGKTYLAKQIAESIGAEYEFVQFHPSYDYTDFVEGLRPVEKDGKLGFERRDGVFKAFCKEAIKGFSLRAAFDKLLEDIKSGKVTTIPLRTKESNILKISPRECITWETYQDESKDSTLVVSFDRLKRLYKHFDSVEKLDRMSNIDEEFRAVIGACKSSYYWAVLRHLLANKQKAENPHPFVFIIDEINRGEVSKIFGELFYAIDSGYRGEKGRINTQYQNLVPEDDPFYKGFYIPENVYIIGTMNDIDRSVECMDFAIRRRFAWKEITVESRQSMLDEEQAWGQKPEQRVIDELKTRMNNLNACIIDEYNKGGEVSKDRIGLTKAHQIGASYFLKYGLYNNFDALWDNHIKGLLYEYLRGTSNIEDKIAKLKEAYQDTNP